MAGDTFWAQRISSPVTAAGSVVTINDTAPTSDRWNLSAVELKGPAAASVPAAPTGVVAVAGNASANVSWTAPSDGGSPITSYTITPFIGAVAQTATTITGSPPATAATVTGLTNGTAYTFTVTATNAVGSGPASAPSVAVTPTAPTAPAAPTGVVAAAGNASANVSWTAPSNGGSPITSYTITPFIGAVAQTATTITGSPPATAATVTGLTNGTAYTFTVTAANIVGPGPASTPSAAVTPTGPTAPAAPTGVVAVAGNASAAVSWTAPSNGGSTITSYTITPYIGAVAQTATTITGSPPTTSASITGLTNGTAYTFTVTATNAMGTGPASAPSAAVTPTAPTAPAAPTGVVAVAGNASAAVSWTAPSNGGSTITSYTITPFIGAVAQTATTITGSPPATSASITGLTNGTAYTFTVTAANIVGPGPASAPSAAVTPAAPSSPVVDVQVSVNATGTTATTPAFNTAQAGETLVALVASDGVGTQTLTVSGAGLTWTLAARANTQQGSSEVWTATAAAKLTGVTVSSAQSKTGYHQMLTVIAVQSSSGIGAVQTAGASSGAPTVSLTTTRAGSLVFGVGNDWDNSVARTVGAGQAIVNQWVDSTVGDTYWAQRLSAPTGAAGSLVTINDTAPTTDRWNFAAVEIKSL